MTIQYSSDLHLEFRENKEFLKANPLQPLGDVLVLAGDIVPFAVMDKHKDFFSYVSDNFAATYWIPGNHEYYGFDLATKCGVLNEKIQSNVFLVNNTSVVQDDVKLIFSTLWSKISPAYEWQIERNMNDFHVIKNGKFRFTAERYNELHAESIAFLEKELTTESDLKKVVATHHVPTLMNYPAQYKGSVLNEAFAVELFDLIEDTAPHCWIYGHSHSNTPDFEIGKTQLLTNQLGYVGLGECGQFNTNRCVLPQTPEGA
jgi:predicted phosphohydrolase